MRPNLLKEKETKTDINEKLNDKITEKAQSVEDELLPEPKEIYVPKQVVDEQPIKPTLPKMNLFSSATFEKSIKDEQDFVKSALKNQITEKETASEEITEDFEIHNQNELELETPHEFFEINAKPKKKKKPMKFRFRLLTCVYCAIIAICSGWVITNAVRISNFQSSIESAQSSYELNELKIIKKIEKLDDLREESQKKEGSSLLPIEEIITIQPLPLENPTEYKQESNWFDSLCNWIGHLFGG